jgi:hypothetical protein
MFCFLVILAPLASFSCMKPVAALLPMKCADAAGISYTAPASNSAALRN